MKLSVALCTYNGEAYIEKQLHSILNQTIPVDEIVVCDDGSTDNTIDIIEAFKRGISIDIRIYRNEKNIGVCANFQKAVNLCNGDIIFLSDQDDIWHSCKTKIIVKWFEDNPNKKVVFTNADIIDCSSREISDSTLFDIVGFNKPIQDFFSIGTELAFVYLGWNYATGATMAIKGKYQFLQYCSKGIYHDFIIFLMAAVHKKAGFISQPLIKYRLHDNQTEGLGRSSNSNRADINNLINPEMNQRWHGYLPIPETNECTSYIHFQWWRSSIISQKQGIISILIRAKKYKSIYNKKWAKCMAYDIKRWMTTKSH